MKEFVHKLEKEIETRLQVVETMDADMLKKALEASRILGNVFDNLKNFTVSYEFQDADEEIHFFKNIKPRICAHLIYYRTIYNIEMNRPVGNVDVQRKYLNKELEDIQDFINKRLDFYRYWRAGCTNLDEVYFMRGKTDMELYLESFYYELDPNFSTNYDFKVARILANDMLQIFIRSELEALENDRHRIVNRRLNIKLNAKKAEIIEMLYGLDTINFFSGVSLKKVTALVEELFDINLGNISRTFSELKSRKVLLELWIYFRPIRMKSVSLHHKELIKMEEKNQSIEQIIKERKSTRNFSTEIPPVETIEKMIESCILDKI